MEKGSDGGCSVRLDVKGVIDRDGVWMKERAQRHGDERENEEEGGREGGR